MIHVIVERFTTVGPTNTVIGVGIDDRGERVAFAPDRATYIMAAPIVANIGPTGVDVEDWRIIV